MNKSLIIAGLFIAASFAGAARAEGEQSAPAVTPPAGALQLQAFTGYWTGTGEMKVPGQETQVINVTVECTDTAAGWGILCKDAMTGKGVNYHETDIMGFDMQSSLVHWFAITNSGELHDHAGQWTGDKRFSVNYTGKIGEKSISEDISMELTGASGLTVKSVAKVDGQESESMTATLTKAKKPKKS